MHLLQPTSLPTNQPTNQPLIQMVAAWAHGWEWSQTAPLWKDLQKGRLFLLPIFPQFGLALEQVSSK